MIYLYEMLCYSFKYERNGEMSMPQLVHVLSEQTIQKMHQFYLSTCTTTPQGAVFRAKTDSAVITAYKSGKVLFQGSTPEVEANKWTNTQTETTKKTTKSTAQTIYTPPEGIFQNDHIGSDEAGTGDYFGPFTVACTYVEKHQIHILKEIGVQDSKNLTDPVIKKISKEIIRLGIPYSLLILHNQKYNILQKKGWSQGKMKAMLHHHAINKLLGKISDKPLSGIVIDQFCDPAVYKRYLASEQEKMADNTYFITKGESHSIAVAAGSIIARTSFLNEMDKLSEQVGIELLRGASNKVDQRIAQVIREKGADILDTCAKVHFANTKKSEQYL